jgi:uncharacterized protein with FMN-binding domain
MKTNILAHEAQAQLAVSSRDNRLQAIKNLKKVKARLKTSHSRTLEVTPKLIVTYNPKKTTRSRVRKVFTNN